MKTQFLIDHRFKHWGWPLLLVGVLWTSISVFAEYEPDFLDWTVPALVGDKMNIGGSGSSGNNFLITNNVADEIGGLATLVGAMLLLLAREKTEDEMINKVRLESLLWAAIVNGIANILALLFIYGIPYFHVMIVNVVFFYLLFIARFHWALGQLKNTTDDQ